MYCSIREAQNEEGGFSPSITGTFTPRLSVGMRKIFCLANPLCWELVSHGACLSAPQTEVVVDFGLKFKLNTLVLFSPLFLSLFSHFYLLI